MRRKADLSDFDIGPFLAKSIILEDLLQSIPYVMDPRHIGIRQYHQKPICRTMAEDIRIPQLILEEIGQRFQGDARIFRCGVERVEGEGEQAQVVLVSLCLFDLQIQQEEKRLPFEHMAECKHGIPRPNVWCCSAAIQ